MAKSKKEQPKEQQQELPKELPIEPQPETETGDELQDPPEEEKSEMQEEPSGPQPEEQAPPAPDLSRTISTGSVSFLSEKEESVDTSLVKVRIKYPHDYKGSKYLTDGEIKAVSKATANQFIEMGIATLV